MSKSESRLVNAWMLDVAARCARLATHCGRGDSSPTIPCGPPSFDAEEPDTTPMQRPSDLIAVGRRGIAA